jgi:hypothetical protein
MAFLTIPNDASVVSIAGKASRKAIVIQNRHAEPIFVNTAKSQLEADETNGIRLEQYQSLSLTGVRGEASVAFHITKQAGVGVGSVQYLEVI